MLQETWRERELSLKTGRSGCFENFVLKEELGLSECK
jgi:hypothetical protein